MRILREIQNHSSSLSTVVALQVCLERLAPLVGDDDGGVDVLLALVVAQVRDPPLFQLALHGEFELHLVHSCVYFSLKG